MENTNLNNNNYKNGKIYMITDNAYTEKYIGSTIVGLSSRMSQHRECYRRFINGNNNQTCISVFSIFDKFGLENCKIELIENVICENKEQLRKIEGDYIKKLDCVNKRIECRTEKEYYIDNLSKILEYQKQYRINHNDKIREYKKEYQIKNKEILSEKKRIYKEKNPERISELNNINKIKNREKIQCPHCDLCICRDSLTKHIKARHTEHQLIQCTHCDKHVQQQNMTNHMNTTYCNSYSPDISRKEVKQEYMKIYRIENAEQIKEKRKEYNSVLTPCEVCGKSFSRSNLAAHLRRMHPE